MLTEIEKQIIDILMDREISRDDILGFTSILDVKHAHKEMLQWLQSNPEAKYNEILEKITEIYEKE